MRYDYPLSFIYISIAFVSAVIQNGPKNGVKIYDSFLHDFEGMSIEDRISSLGIEYHNPMFTETICYSVATVLEEAQSDNDIFSCTPTLVDAEVLKLNIVYIFPFKLLQCMCSTTESLPAFYLRKSVSSHTYNRVFVFKTVDNPMAFLEQQPEKLFYVYGVYDADSATLYRETIPIQK